MCLARAGNCARDPVLETGPLKRHILTFYSVYPHSVYIYIYICEVPSTTHGFPTFTDMYDVSFEPEQTVEF